MKYYIFLVLAIFFNILTNTFFKLAGISTQARYLTYFVTGLFFGLLNSYFITEAVRRIPLSTAFTIFSGSSILLLTLVSNLFFREVLTPKKLIGIIVVCVGIYLLVQENG